MGFNLPMLAAVVNVFSPDRMLFGSDYWPLPISPREHIDVVNRLNLNAAQHEDIFWRNANRMFHLSLEIARRPPLSLGQVAYPAIKGRSARRCGSTWPSRAVGQW